MQNRNKSKGDFTDSNCSTDSDDEVHPLSPKWVLWLWKGDRNMSWQDCLEQQCVITSIEDFIALRHRILPPSRLPPQELNYYVFKEGIKPMWEDPSNSGGGTIDVLLGRQYQFTRLDQLWFELLMAALGGQFDDNNCKICGVAIRLRSRGYAISLWLTDVSSVRVYAPILEVLETKLGITNDSAVNIQVNSHPKLNRQHQMNGGGEDNEYGNGYGLGHGQRKE